MALFKRLRVDNVRDLDLVLSNAVHFNVCAVLERDEVALDSAEKAELLIIVTTACYLIFCSLFIGKSLSCLRCLLLPKTELCEFLRFAIRKAASARVWCVNG